MQIIQTAFLSFMLLLVLITPFAQGRIFDKNELLMPRIDNGFIKIDGDIGEWRDMPPGYIDALWDVAEGKLSDQQREDNDRGMFHIAHDAEALYFAIRVVDKSVYNPYDVLELWKGDCVELFLDVRPVEPSEGKPGLGQQEYTPGCYQLMLTPSDSPENATRWRCGKKTEHFVQQMELASKLLEDGYTLECRIPLEQLYETTLERLSSPIGIDIAIDDVDGPQLSRVHYVWGGKAGNHQNANQFQRALPVTSDAQKNRVIRFVGGRFSNETSTLITGVVLPASENIPPDTFSLSYDFRNTPYDRPESWKDGKIPPGDNPKPVATEGIEERVDSVLGLRVIQRKLQFTILVGGRYTFRSRFEGRGEIVEDTVNAFYFERKFSPSMGILDKLLNDAELTEAMLKEYFHLYSTHHVFGASEIDVTVAMGRNALIYWGLSEQAERGKQNGKNHLVRLDVFSAKPTQELVYTVSAPFYERRLSIPTSELEEGVYLVRMRIIEPSGEVHEILYPPEGKIQNPSAPTIFIGIHGQRDYILKTNLEPSEPIFTRATLIGAPNRKQFPNDDARHCYARSIWDLHYYQGRIYIGCGDWQENQGPIDIWSFGPSEDNGKDITFTKEFTVDDESVDLLCSYEGRLLAPGTDAKESWDFGNLYIKENDQWRKVRTIPNGLHAFDAAYFNGKLYVTTGTERGAVLYESSDWGETWERYSTDDVDEFSDGRYWEMEVLGDRLLVAPSRDMEYICSFRDNNLERLVIPLLPNASGPMPVHRLTAFAGGVLYTFRMWEEADMSKPLYFLKDLEKGAVIVEQFQQERVQDILVRGDKCYVLTSKPSGNEYINCVYQSSELEKWTLMAKFHTSALAQSLEEMDGEFYVGLASFSNDPRAASGGIYRID
jgi:hypothetical protein